MGNPQEVVTKKSAKINKFNKQSHTRILALSLFFVPDLAPVHRRTAFRRQPPLITSRVTRKDESVGVTCTLYRAPGVLRAFFLFLEDRRIIFRCQKVPYRNKPSLARCSKVLAYFSHFNFPIFPTNFEVEITKLTHRYEPATKIMGLDYFSGERSFCCTKMGVGTSQPHIGGDILGAITVSCQ